MIKRALEYLSDELALALGLDESEFHLERLQKLQEQSAQGLVISLLNVEQEHTLKNTKHYTRNNKEELYYREPPVYLNLNMLLAFEFGNYPKSLRMLSRTVEFFQERRWFSADSEDSETAFPPQLEKLVLDLMPLNFEQLNHIWGVSGGAHFPSLLYKVRLVKITPRDKKEGTEISSIQLESTWAGDR